jgi:hypothetical protein
MAEFSIQRVRVGFTVTRADNGRLCVTCEFLDDPHDLEALAPVLRSGWFGFDGCEGVMPEQAAERAHLMSETRSHLPHTALAWHRLGRAGRAWMGVGR